MPDDAIRVLAGDCTVTYQGDQQRREERGEVVVLVKPDNTVLVHDVDGYQPVSWLTRADSVSFSREGGAVLRAAAGDQHLEVVAHAEYGYAHYPATAAGVPVGDCPDCTGVLVRAGGEVTCTGCRVRYGLPSGAKVTERTCDCGLPTMRVERGAPFEVCIDRECESLDAAVRERFDREWDCPACGGDLRVLRRGGLLAGCERYPDCETGFAIPDGTVVEECGCGLPRFDVGGAVRCLDTGCEEEA